MRWLTQAYFPSLTFVAGLDWCKEASFAPLHLSFHGNEEGKKREGKGLGCVGKEEGKGWAVGRRKRKRGLGWASVGLARSDF